MSDTKERGQKTLKEPIKTGKEIFEEIDSCFDRHCSSGYNMKESEVPDYEKELVSLNNQKWVGVEGLVAELKKKAKWRTEEKMSTEFEEDSEVTRYRPRQYVRLDEVLSLVGCSEKQQKKEGGEIDDINL